MKIKNNYIFISPFEIRNLLILNNLKRVTI